MANVTDIKNRVIGYVRVSTEEQAQEGFSLEAQSRQIATYCSLRRLELVELVADPGVSAGKKLLTREGGRRLIELVRRKRAGGVVAWKLDRLFRDARECLTVVDEWDRGRAALHLVDLGGQTFDTSTAMGRFFLTVMAGAAELERNMIRERTKAGMGVKRDRGELVGSVPYGFQLARDGRTLKPHAKEQETLKVIRRLRGRKLTQRAIADRLNAQKVPARGQRWHVTTVARLLRRGA